MFKELMPLLDKCDLKMVLSSKNNQISVTVVAYNDKGVEGSFPLSMKGTPEEMDQYFLFKVLAPNSQVRSFYDNLGSQPKGKDKEKPSDTTKPKSSTLPAPEVKPSAGATGDLFMQPEMPVKTTMPVTKATVTNKEGVSINAGTLRPVEPKPQEIFPLKEDNAQTSLIDTSDDW